MRNDVFVHVRCQFYLTLLTSTDSRVVWLGCNADMWTCHIVNIVLWIVGVSRPVLNQTAMTVWFSTAPGASRLPRGKRAVSPCIHAGSNDATFRWLSQLGGIVRAVFRKQHPERLLITLRFDGSQPPWWRRKFGGRNNTAVFDNIDFGDLPTAIRWCSSRLRCYRFSMSDVYIGQTLIFQSPHKFTPNLRLCCFRHFCYIKAVVSKVWLL